MIKFCLFGKSKHPEASVVADNIGFTMTHTSDIPATYVRWSDIKEVSAYTADDFTVDALCVEITTLTGQVCLFTEDVDGFSVFIEQMGKGIPTIPADWYQKIIQPAFAENHTILFEKEI